VFVIANCIQIENADS